MLRGALQSGGHALDAGRRMAGSAFWGLAGAGRSGLGYLGGMERGLLQLGRATLEEVSALEARRALGHRSADSPGAYRSLRNFSTSGCMTERDNAGVCWHCLRADR